MTQQPSEEVLIRLNEDIWNPETKSLLVYYYADTDNEPLLLVQGYHSIVAMRKPTRWYGALTRYYPNLIKGKDDAELCYYLASSTSYSANEVDLIRFTEVMNETMTLLRKYWREP